MNNSLLIRIAATLAALSLVGVASTAAAGQLPPPLGAGHQALSPGVQVLDLVSRETSPGGPAQLPQIELTLPKGWFNYDGWGMNDGGTLIVSFWDVNKVYPTGCHWASKPMIDPGPTVNGLARALYTRPLRHASKPRAVTLGGFHGKYLRWSVPRNMSWAHCRQGYFESWTAKGWASDRYQQGGGQVDRLWILNVDGQRLVIDAAYLDATKKQRAELNRIVHSIQFLPESTKTAAGAGRVSRTFRSEPAPRPSAEPSSLKVKSVEVSAINNAGQVVGTLVTKSGVHHGFVWTNGSVKLLGAEADAINDAGQILGYTKYSKAHGPQHLVLWENGKTLSVGLTGFRALNDRGEVIGEIRGNAAIWQNGSVSLLPLRWAVAINNQGQVVGNAANGDLAEWQNGKLTDLGPGTPYAINSHGEILGYLNGDAAIWQNGTATDLGPGSNGIAMNDRGDVILAQGTDPNDRSVYSALLWQDGKTTDLGNGTDDQAFDAQLISNSDQVAGQLIDYDNTDGSYSFVWQNGTTTRLPGSPLDLVAMNDNNQIIGDDCGCYRRGIGRVYNSKLAVLWTLQNGKATTTTFPHRIPRR